MITIDFDEYSRFYPADSQEDFARLLPDAELRMDVITANRWRAVGEADWRAGRVKRCLAEVLHVAIEADQSPAVAGATIVSNDKLTVHYASTQQIEESTRSLAQKWLSQTGLISAL